MGQYPGEKQLIFGHSRQAIYLPDSGFSKVLVLLNIARENIHLDTNRKSALNVSDEMLTTPCGDEIELNGFRKVTQVENCFRASLLLYTPKPFQIS